MPLCVSREHILAYQALGLCFVLSRTYNVVSAYRVPYSILGMLQDRIDVMDGMELYCQYVDHAHTYRLVAGMYTRYAYSLGRSTTIPLLICTSTAGRLRL
jgi:hypothetical protein